jgi:hypothetical protein
MKSFISRLDPLQKFAILQVAAAGLAFGLPFAISIFAVWILDPIFGFAGTIVGIVACTRSVRNGISTRRMVVTCLLTWFGCAVAWWGGAIALGEAVSSIRVPWHMHNFVAFRCEELPIFTTACLAYFEVGPFRPRIAAETA